MKSELSFLLDLFLLPDISLTMRDMLVARIREVEAKLASPTHCYIPATPNLLTPPYTITSNGTGQVVPQAPSTVAAMARHEGHVVMAPPPAPPPVPVAVIAQTPAAAAAMQSRQDAIAASLSGKIDKASGRPRKF